jgi:branched-chain amino acid transport system permease protein
MDRLRRSLYVRNVTKTSGLLIGILLIIAIVGALSAGTGSSLTLIIPNFFITVIIVIALQMFTGNSGVVSWGHSAFVGIGAYVTAWLTVPAVIKSDVFDSMPSWLLNTEWKLLPTIVVATAAGTLVAALIGIVLCRMKETAMAMSTLALLVIAHGVYANWFGMTRGAQGVYGLPQNTTLWGAFGFACFAVIVGVMFRDSRVGLRLQASREDPLAAEATGVSVVKSRYIAWVASAALAALSGSVWAQFNLAFDPSQFYYTQVFAVLSMLVIGGMATMSGAILGAAVVTVISQILYNLEGGSFFGMAVPRISGLQQMILAIITLLILIYRRNGILSWWELDEWVRKGKDRFFPGKGSEGTPRVGSEKEGV